jgi:hypothetical protein
LEVGVKVFYQLLLLNKFFQFIDTGVLGEISRGIFESIAIRRGGQVLQSSNLVCLVDLVSLVDFVFLVCLVFKFLIYKENGRGKTDE